MLAGFLLGIVHDRRLMREAQVNLAIRWFAGYGLHEALPDHSIADPHPAALGRRALPAHLRAHGSGLHRGQDRQGRDRPRRCLADPRRCELGEPRRPPCGGGRRRRTTSGTKRPSGTAGKTGRYKKVCVDRSGRHAWRPTARNRRLEPCYKQHTVVDDAAAWCWTSRSQPARSNEGQIVDRAGRRDAETPGSRSRRRRRMPATPTPRSTARWSGEASTR